MLAKKRELLWSNDGCSQVDDEIIPFDGLPFFFLGKKVYECKDGKRKAHKRKVYRQLANYMHKLVFSAVAVRTIKPATKL